MAQDYDKFVIRFPGDMREALHTVAAANRRSLNAEIVYRLTEAREPLDYNPDVKKGRGNQYPVRLPDGLRDEIKETAARAGRSMNAEIVLRLAGGELPVKTQEKPVPATPEKEAPASPLDSTARWFLLQAAGEMIGKSGREHPAAKMLVRQLHYRVNANTLQGLGGIGTTLTSGSGTWRITNVTPGVFKCPCCGQDDPSLSHIEIEAVE